MLSLFNSNITLIINYLNKVRKVKQFLFVTLKFFFHKNQTLGI